MRIAWETGLSCDTVEPGPWPNQTSNSTRLPAGSQDLAQYESLLTVSPPFLEPRAHQVWRFTESLTNRTNPSVKQMLTPPG